METLETISAALKCTDKKKEDLKKAFDELQSHSSVLSAFSLTWSDLDAHFTTLQNSLTERFHLLESLELENQTQTHCTESTQLTPKIDPCASQGQNAQTNPEDPSSSSISETQITQIQVDPSGDVGSDSVTPPRPELRALCESMDGKEIDPCASQGQNAQTNPEDPSSSSILETQMTQIRVDPSGDVGSDSAAPPRPELRALCESMDGMGLRKYVLEHPYDKKAMMAELPGAMRCASDPAAMVLDAMEGFYGVKGDKEGDVGGLRRSCVLLLEALMGVKVNVGVGVRERAKELALAWKGKASSSEVQNFEVMGFLHLVAAYGLQSEFDADELVDCFVIVAQFRQAVKLCRGFGLGDNVADLIQKLISKGKHLLAVKFIFEFELTEKFPPVPLLKSYLKDAKKLAKKVWKKGNESHVSLNKATDKELVAMKSVIKVIESHNLDSQFPRANLEKRVEALEKLIVNRKRPAAAPPAIPQQPQQQQQQPKKQKKQLEPKKQQHLQPKKQQHLQPKKRRQQQQQQQQSRSKHPRIAPPVGHGVVPVIVDGANSSIPHYRQSHLRSAGLLSDCPAPYASSSSVPYGMVGQIPTSAPFTGSSAGLYGIPGAPVGFRGNPSPSSSHLYSSEPYASSGYYDRPTAYGGYGARPKYHPSYYPQ